MGKIPKKWILKVVVLILKKSQREALNLQRLIHEISNEFYSTLLANFKILEEIKKESSSDNYKTLFLIERIEENKKNIELKLKGLLEYHEVVTKGRPSSIFLLDDVLKEIKSEFDLSIQTEGTVTFNADFRQIKLLFKHLFDNSITFSETKLKEVHIQVEQKEDATVITYTDNSSGISKENLENAILFFHTCSNSKGKAGMGLSICQKIAERHNGSIELFPKPGFKAIITLKTSIILS